MKSKLLLVIAFLVAFAPMAMAEDLEGNLGGYNASGVLRLRVTTDGTVTFATDSSVIYPYIDATTNDTLETYDSGKTIVFRGSIPSTFTLPIATPGLQYTFTSTVAKAITVDPNGTDTIKYLSLSAGDKMTSTALVGDSVTLFCVLPNEWAVSNMHRVWVDAN